MPATKLKKTALSKRAEIISGFAFGRRRSHTAAAESGHEPQPYEPDPDETVKCPNCGKFDDVDAAYCDQCGFKLEGAEGVEVLDKEGDGEEGGEDMAADAEAPETPVDSEGNVKDDHVCEDGDCGHEAMAHMDTDQGKNTGACTAAGCECLAMKVDAAVPAEGEEAPPEKDAQTAAGPEPVEEPAEEGEPTEAAMPAGNEPPEVEGSDDVGPAFSIPVGIIEGQPTGDGREIEPGALDWRTPPLPLMLLATETHDPNGWDLNDPAVLAGRVTGLERTAGDGGTQVVSATGNFLNTDEGRYAAELVDQMGRMGVSADVAVEESKIDVTDTDEIGFPTEMSEKLVRGTIMGFTMCPYAAFEGAYIVLAEDEEAAPAPIEQASEAPAAVTAGGQLIHWMAYEECEPCKQDDLELIVASGGPERPPKAWFSDPGFEPGDGRLVEILGRDGRREPGGKFACPLTVTDDGRIYGHIAPWGVCHKGKAGECVIAPRGGNYVHFTRSQHIVTAEGEQVRVGVITADTGHAGLRLSPSAAMAHYDDTALAAADVQIGEDDYGIWVAGAVRPDATEAQVRKLRAASISGDWRRIAGRMELIAALAVNMPGYPITPVEAVTAGGAVEALTAAGAVVMGHLKDHQEDAPDPMVTALSPLLGMAKTHATDRLSRLRA